MKQRLILMVATLLIFQLGWSQQTFTLQDTLRGSITPERAWWDLTYYHLKVQVHPEEKMLDGEVVVQYKVLEEGANNAD